MKKDLTLTRLKRELADILYQLCVGYYQYQKVVTTFKKKDRGCSP